MQILICKYEVSAFMWKTFPYSALHQIKVERKDLLHDHQIESKHVLSTCHKLYRHLSLLVICRRTSLWTILLLHQAQTFSIWHRLRVWRHTFRKFCQQIQIDKLPQKLDRGQANVILSAFLMWFDSPIHLLLMSSLVKGNCLVTLLIVKMFPCFVLSFRYHDRKCAKYEAA